MTRKRKENNLITNASRHYSLRYDNKSRQLLFPNHSDTPKFVSYVFHVFWDYSSSGVETTFTRSSRSYKTYGQWRTFSKFYCKMLANFFWNNLQSEFAKLFPQNTSIIYMQKFIDSTSRWLDFLCRSYFCNSSIEAIILPFIESSVKKTAAKWRWHSKKKKINDAL